MNLINNDHSMSVIFIIYCENEPELRKYTRKERFYVIDKIPQNFKVQMNNSVKLKTVNFKFIAFEPIPTFIKFINT